MRSQNLSVNLLTIPAWQGSIVVIHSLYVPRNWDIRILVLVVAAESVAEFMKNHSRVLVL